LLPALDGLTEVEVQLIEIANNELVASIEQATGHRLPHAAQSKISKNGRHRFTYPFLIAMQELHLFS
jgi:hypothetical protein